MTAEKRPPIPFKWGNMMHILAEGEGILAYSDDLLGVSMSINTPRNRASGNWGKQKTSYCINDEKPKKWYESEQEFIDALWEKSPLRVQEAIASRAEGGA